MNKIIKFGSIVLGIVMLAFLFTVLQEPQKASSSANIINTVYMTKGGGSYTSTAPATTTVGVTYLAASATTTFPFYSERADMVNLDINMTASTSAGTLVLTYETSNTDANCASDPLVCNWSLPSTVASGVIASTTPTYTWRPDGSANATTSLSYTINPVNSKFIRVKASVTGSAGALWLSASGRSQQP